MQRIHCFLLSICSVFASAVPTVSIYGQDNDSELVCITPQPVVGVGANVELRAWLNEADNLSPTQAGVIWDVDRGQILPAVGGSATWDLSKGDVAVGEVERLVARGEVRTRSGRRLQCVVSVFVDDSYGQGASIGTLRGVNLISGRAYLFPNNAESGGYGLYTYLLLNAPPKNEEEAERYLKTIEAFLLLVQDVDEYLRRHVRPRELNISYLPLTKAPLAGESNAQSARNVLEVYDYAAAQILLRNLDESHEQGPYLVSSLKPLSLSSATPILRENLVGVAPELVWDWVSNFNYLAAQERTWSTTSLRKFGLTLRNVLAAGGRVAPVVLDEFERAFRFYESRKD